MPRGKNQQKAIVAFFKAHKPVAAICQGVVAAARTIVRVPSLNYLGYSTNRREIPATLASRKPLLFMFANRVYDDY